MSTTVIEGDGHTKNTVATHFNNEFLYTPNNTPPPQKKKKSPATSLQSII
jgi:hypothetical protein